MLPLLTHWQEIVLPDLRGSGASHYPDGQEYPFSLSTLVADINALVSELSWQQFDLAGYSLGGLLALLFKQHYPGKVAKQFLLEAALLDRPIWQDSMALRQQYTDIARQLRQDEPRQAALRFLDTIASQRPRIARVDALAISRLVRRPEGFSYALQCVSEGMQQLDREALLAAQGDVTSCIGGRSVTAMHQYHQHMAEHLPNWHYFLIAGTDHSLPFQKPRQLAELFNREMARYLGQPTHSGEYPDK